MEDLSILFVIILLSLILVSVEFPIHVSVGCLEQSGAEFSKGWTSPARLIEPTDTSCASDNFDILSAGTSQVALVELCFPLLEIPVLSVC